MSKRTARITSLETDLNARYLGHYDVEVSQPLTDGDRIELSIEQSRALEESKKLEGELKDLSDQYKGKIKDLNSIAYKMARIVNKGSKEITKNLPCFYSAREEMRLCVDPETGEVLHKTQARPFDAQTNLDDLERRGNISLLERQDG